MTAPLHLAAEDEDDLRALSALVQDSVLQVGDMAFLPRARRFALVLNRYRWEAAGQGETGRAGERGERVRAGLRVEEVVAARALRIRQDARDIVLSLLALTFAPDGAGGGVLTLAFAGGAEIALTVEALEVHLDDIGGPWAARARPSHKLD